MTTEKPRYSRKIKPPRPGVCNARDAGERLNEQEQVIDMAVRDVVRRTLCTRTYGILGGPRVSRIGCVRLMVMAHFPKEYLFWHTGTLAHETEG